MNTIAMPVAEVIDRLTICELKVERLDDEAEREMMRRQVSHYAKGVAWSDPKIIAWRDELRRINGLMWDAEAAIRAGQDEGLGLEEIGRRALHIRDLNRERIAAKNEISEYVGDGMADCKVNYAR